MQTKEEWINSCKWNLEKEIVLEKQQKCEKEIAISLFLSMSHNREHSYYGHKCYSKRFNHNDTSFIVFWQPTFTHKKVIMKEGFP